jgi:hypothetical protein
MKIMTLGKTWWVIIGHLKMKVLILGVYFYSKDRESYLF